MSAAAVVDHRRAGMRGAQRRGAADRGDETVADQHPALPLMQRRRVGRQDEGIAAPAKHLSRQQCFRHPALRFAAEPSREPGEGEFRADPGRYGPDANRHSAGRAGWR